MRSKLRGYVLVIIIKGLEGLLQRTLLLRRKFGSQLHSTFLNGVKQDDTGTVVGKAEASCLRA